MYFLDYGNHVYEYHAPDIDTACSLVTDYFNSTLDLQKFDKHLLDIGADKHFISKRFEYRFNETKFIFNYIVLCALTLFLIGMLGVATSRIGTIGIILLAFAYGFFKLHKAYLSNYKLKDAYLQLSKGSVSFTYGIGKLKTFYLKANIQGIRISNASGKNEQSAIYDITFKDGTSIRFSGFLIPYFDFINKFSGIDIQYTRNKWPVSL